MCKHNLLHDWFIIHVQWTRQMSPMSGHFRECEFTALHHAAAKRGKKRQNSVDVIVSTPCEIYQHVPNLFWHVLVFGSCTHTLTLYFFTIFFSFFTAAFIWATLTQSSCICQPRTWKNLSKKIHELRKKKKDRDLLHEPGAPCMWLNVPCDVNSVFMLTLQFVDILLCGSLAGGSGRLQ